MHDRATDSSELPPAQSETPSDIGGKGDSLDRVVASSESGMATTQQSDRRSLTSLSRNGRFSFQIRPRRLAYNQSKRYAMAQRG